MFKCFLKVEFKTSHINSTDYFIIQLNDIDESVENILLKRIVDRYDCNIEDIEIIKYEKADSNKIKLNDLYVSDILALMGEG